MFRAFSTQVLKGNLARELGEFGCAFIGKQLGEGPALKTRRKLLQLHADSVICGLAALAQKTNAPTVLRKEALNYPDRSGAILFADKKPVKVEKAVLANCAAVRELDANGTNFGYKSRNKYRQAGEFGHNDFYPVVMAAACQDSALTGQDVLYGMLLLDEVRARLAEVFALRDFKIDHVLHGAIGSVVAYGALRGLKPVEIEQAIGLVVGHCVPYRGIRHGQLTDSKGSSDAFHAEQAVLAVQRVANGFVGPQDVFNNEQCVFGKYFSDLQPFELELCHSGNGFAVNDMHLKLGLYEHQTAGAIQAVVDIYHENPSLVGKSLRQIEVEIYNPAFDIIADPEKKRPKNRQTADHSLYWILASLIKSINSKGSPMMSTQQKTKEQI